MCLWGRGVIVCDFVTSDTFHCVLCYFPTEFYAQSCPVMRQADSPSALAARAPQQSLGAGQERRHPALSPLCPRPSLENVVLMESLPLERLISFCFLFGLLCGWSDGWRV